MPIVKVVELIAQSEKSFDDAVNVALAEAAKTIRNIKSIYVQDMQGIVENNKIVLYRINTKVSFLVDR